MKLIRSLHSRFKLKTVAGRNKRGASLAMVAIIGAVLAIWVFGIMPLMTTTGRTAIKLQSDYDDYLDSRSAIEFCKSELEKIVETEVPYTFAVLRNNDANRTFYAVPKMDGIEMNSQYMGRVVYDTSNDMLDVPANNAAGNEVVAICAVELSTTNANVFDIHVSTYHNGVKGLGFSATYTLRGSLLITPEAYGSKQALPLSDYVLVDGKLGCEKVWNSNITKSTADSFIGSASSYESLLAWKETRPYTFYANSGEYPAVFKTTAHAASDGGTPMLPVDTGILSNENWIIPKAGNTELGDIWYEDASNKVYMFIGTYGSQFDAAKVNGTALDITSVCDIYYNGAAGKPSSGYYAVSIIYNGTGAYVANGLNVLPAKGIHLGSFGSGLETNKQSLSEKASVSLAKSGDVITATINVSNSEAGNTPLKYGYCTSDNTTVVWGDSNKISGLDANKTYYFYICRPAALKSDGYYTDSDVKYAGRAYPMKTVSKLEVAPEGEDPIQYLVIGQYNGDYRAMNLNGNNLNTVNLGNSGMLTLDRDGTTAWMALQEGAQWRLYAENSSGTVRYLQLTLSYSWGRWSSSIDTSNSAGTNGLLDVTFDSNNAANVSVSKTVQAGWNSVTRTSSLNVTDSVKGSINSKTTVLFAKIPKDNHPSASRVNKPTHLYTYDTTKNTVSFGISPNDLKAYIQQYISPAATVASLKANGASVNGTLQVGAYDISVMLDNGIEFPLGVKFRVAQVNLPATPVISTSKYDSNDDLAVRVTGSNWNNDNNYRYIGWAEAPLDAEDGAELTEEQEQSLVFHWYYVTGDSFDFRLGYGKYVFAIAESGTNNHRGTCHSGMTVSTVVSVVPEYIELTEADAQHFQYTYNSAMNACVWYDLPENIYPSRVTLVFGYREKTDGPIIWEAEYSGRTRFYGVLVLNSNYDNLEQQQVLRVAPPTKVSYVGGYTSSMMSGSSLYFMGSGTSINTHGNDIYLSTDLLVLGSSIAGVSDDSYSEGVYVTPYSLGKTSTLLYAVKDIKNPVGETVFQKYHYYVVPKDADILNVNAATAAGWHKGTIDSTEVQYFFRSGTYPEMNGDIAYANADQLNHIVSSETFGWTQDGVLKGSSEDFNLQFAVCVFTIDISNTSDISYTANRVLIAGKEPKYEEGVLVGYTADNIGIPANLNFTCRYLSITASTVTQENTGVKFTMTNLGKDQDIVDEIIRLIGKIGNIVTSEYLSKSMQVDYERYTVVGGVSHQPRIVRYEADNEQGVIDLFQNPPKKELMANYTGSEIAATYSGYQISSRTRVVDRYTSISPTSGSSSLDFGGHFEVSNYLDVYSNYIYFEPNLTSITIKSFGQILWFDVRSDILINSQERGYKSEYLGWFTNYSTESYKGTLIYIASPTGLTITYDYLNDRNQPDEHITIAQGFYYIYATEDGTSLLALDDLYDHKTATGPNSTKKPEKVYPEDLHKFSIYIKPDGTLSDTYVDTGLFDNDSAGLGGFSGGSVE